MLGGLEGYGSDESESESSKPTQTRTTSSSSKKSSFSLPPPTNATKAPSLPLPKGKSKRPVFTVVKPSKAASDDEDYGQERAAKKPRLESRTGAGSSSLLAVLPAPSKAAPVPAAPPRVLGGAAQGGGGTGVMMPPPANEYTSGEEFNGLSAQNTAVVAKSTSLFPPSLAKGKGKPPVLSKESVPAPLAPTVDFFSLGIPAPRVVPTASTSKSTDPAELSSSSVAITSAPTIPTFEPPPPTPSDPYPGYYQLPSGQWAAYDPEFYRKHYEAWSMPQGLDSTTQKGFEGAEGDGTVEVDGQEQLDLARKEREEKKALTKDAGGGPGAPKMNIKAAKVGSRARTRHQLSALLHEAYDNREALEEQIAQGRRNRKEAGNKYGF